VIGRAARPAKRLLASLAALSLLAGPAGITAEAPYAPGRYLVDPAETSVHFTVKQLPFGHYAGRFVEPAGTVTIDSGRASRASVDIAFPVEKLTTGDMSTDALLEGSSFFDAGRFPMVRFTGADVPLAGDDIPVRGDLTMHGITRPVTFTARLAGIRSEAGAAHPQLRFTGDAAVRRSEFAMGFGRPFVSNRVELRIEASFRAE
jgi:polyisoprenoid-binding protein YceI